MSTNTKNEKTTRLTDVIKPHPSTASPTIYTSSSSPTATSSSTWGLKPGFLADHEVSEEDLRPSPTSSTSSSPSSTLPYLRDSPSKPWPTSSSTSSSPAGFKGFISSSSVGGYGLSGPSKSVSTPITPQKSPQPSQSSVDMSSPSHKPASSPPHASSSRLSPLPSSTSRGSSSGRNSPLPKRRPSPLELKGKSVGLDEEYEIQREEEELEKSARSDTPSTLSNEMQDLSSLRRSVRQNLIARPVDSPLPHSDSGISSGFDTPASAVSSFHAEGATITIEQVLSHLDSSHQPLIMDCRPLTDFLDLHFPRSANVAIPSLISKRFRKPDAQWTAGWEALGGFVTTQAGKQVWESVNSENELDVVIIGFSGNDEMASILRRILTTLVRGQVRILEGGWEAVKRLPRAVEHLVSGDKSEAMDFSQSPEQISTSLPPPKSAPIFNLPPPPIPSSSASPPKVSHHPSMPQLRSEGSRRNLPTLAIPPGSTRRTPKLSLNLDKPLRSATLGSFSDQSLSKNTGGVRKKSSMLTIDVSGEGRRSPGLPPLKSPHATSFQTLCHEQSKLPPSPSSFGDVKRILGDDQVLMPGSGSSRSNYSSSPNSPSGTARPGSFLGIPAGPTYGVDSSSSATDGQVTARNGMAPFIVSTILPSFLFLGPEISTARDVEELQRLGIKRILNVAIECDDDEGLGLRETFDKYHRVPMRDIVEESGVARGMRDSCEFLDDARLHSAPTYVHCKAGKSRSVTVVLAYLIHANAWTLKTSYAYVAERRKGISPNIGFVAELMQFEEAELGLKQSGGVHGEGNAGGNSNEGGGTGRRGDEDYHDDAVDHDGPGGGKGKGTRNKMNPRYMRESLPPAWASSLDSSRPARIPLGDDEGEGDRDRQEKEDGSRRQVGEEREIRKNGQWVHSRRTPVNRTTLNPGRRVSKAGLESLRPLNPTTQTVSPSTPSPGEGKGSDKRDHASTPGPDGKLGWI